MAATPVPERLERALALAKGLFDDEEARRQELDGRAGAVLSLSALYAGFIVFVLKDHPVTAGPARLFVIGAILFLGLALALAAWTSMVRTYETPFEPDDLVRSYDDKGLSLQRFLEVRMADYLTAAKRNAKVCDGKVRVLLATHVCLVVGIILHAISVLLLF